ncbi:MAG: NADH-quinone oxidoreductase subunit J [Casimicrobiaceae bacterium]
MIETLLLWAFAGTALLSAASMLVLRHPMRVALALVVTMLALAGVYALLGVHVIAIFQVLIYVGAVMVFMVYVIMLLDVRDRSYTRKFSWLLVPGTAGALLLLALLAQALWQSLPAELAGEDSPVFGVAQFSVTFLNEYWLHFELISVLLVVAVVAALAVIKVGRRDHG